jgi:hypothetical protein
MPQVKRETEISADQRPTFGHLENNKQFQSVGSLVGLEPSNAKMTSG